MDGPLIELQDFQQAFGSQLVLNNISLSLHPGETVAIIGKSGSGKSTLLNHLRSQLQDKCAWCPQDIGLVPILSVFHNIFMGGLKKQPFLFNLRNLIYPTADTKAEILKIAETLGIGEKLMTSVELLSGGQQQRVALGRALFEKKSTLLADEPFAGLDEFQTRSLLDALLSSHKTVVMSLHNTELACSYFDRVIALKEGEISLDCSADQVSSQTLAELYE